MTTRTTLLCMTGGYALPALLRITGAIPSPDTDWPWFAVDVGTIAVFALLLATSLLFPSTRK